ncbi:phage tail protein [Acinetobacter bereziniae]|uniref:phage tail protein n=1 Tax=Acinetobacter bereziniae TaxID=106648 RepID=UPI00073EFD35|nr:phage tail protein [Acinetobacter bereziniae]
MGGSKSQTVGYKYFAGLMVVIGNRIEKLLDINPAEKGWIVSDERPSENDSMFIHYPDLFGGDKKEGGWVGFIDTHLGANDQKQNKYLAQHIGEDVSAFPNLSYLVFRGADVLGNHYQENTNKGFQFVSMSGMMKEFLLWVKRTRIRNDGSLQWYDSKSEIPDFEIYNESGFKDESLNFKFKKIWSDDLYGGYEEEIERIYTSGSRYFFNPNGGNFPGENYSSASGSYIHAQNDLGENFKMYAEFSINTGLIAGIIEMYYEIRTIGDFIKITPYSVKDSEILMIETISEEVSDKSINRTLKVTYNIIGGSVGIRVSTKGRRLTGILDDSEAACSVLFYGYRVKTEKFRYVKYGDMNPIHKIREILTDYTAMGKPESDVNDENFRLVAERIYDEGLGFSWCIQQKSCKEALEELEYHIEGGVRINRQTGLYEVILFRDDLLDLDDALHFDESNIKSFQPDIINVEDQINAVNVSFYDRENIKDSSFSLSDVGSFHTIDHENAEDLKFPYFMNRRNAEKVANWKLKQLSTMAWKGTFTTGKYEARKLNKYDVVMLSWKSKNIVNLPVRVMNINLGNGRDNTVTLDFVEVVPYSSISYSSINVDPNPNPILPPQSNSSIVFEMPYFEAVQRMGQTSVDTELANNPEIGYLMAAAIKPQNNSLNALLYTDGGSNTLDLLEEVGVVDYCASCSLDQDISFTDTSFAVKKMQDLSRVKVGTLVQVDQELLVYQSYDTETKVLTVKRGALDTLPRPHLKDAVFYFWDDSSGLDQTVYVDGETVHAKVLTTTPSGVENLGTSAVRILEINGRANRPYPPANVKINDEYYPDEIENDLVLTWVDRNRVQQTGGEILGFFEPGVTLESGVSYQLILIERDENNVVLRTQNLSLGSLNTYTFATSSMDANTFSIEITLKSLRDGFESYQSFNHVVEQSLFFSAPYDLKVEFKND